MRPNPRRGAGRRGADPAPRPESATNDPPISGKVSPGPGATFGKTGYDLQTPWNALTTPPPMPRLPAQLARGKDSVSATDTSSSRPWRFVAVGRALKKDVDAYHEHYRTEAGLHVHREYLVTVGRRR